MSNLHESRCSIAVHSGLLSRRTYLFRLKEFDGVGIEHRHASTPGLSRIPGEHQPNPFLEYEFYLGRRLGRHL